ncbi:MAG TPA: DUF4384 domain-containing protein [Blastocatellia bacterium]|jgi:hypothetical protein
MNFKILFSLLTLILIASLPQLAQEHDRDEETRNAFLITRKKASRGKSSRPPVESRQRPAGPLGLGYTLYQKDGSDKPVRADLAHEFHAGDAVRLVIESNTNGYLYVFHAENDGEPRMIFPDARLNGGDNRISIHVPYEVPSSQEPDPKFRWFYFDEKAATERLYLVVTRKPLPEVPTSDALVAYCRTNQGGCPWRPASTIWNPIAANVNAPTFVSQEQAFGRAQTEVERVAVERGLGLPPDAPAPSVIKVSSSPKSRMLIAVLDLIHK